MTDVISEETTEVRQTGQEVASRTAVISLRLRKPTAKRKATDGTVKVISNVEEEDDPQQDSTTVSVELLKGAEYQAIKAYDRATTERLKARAVGTGRRLAAGSYMVPLVSIEELMGWLDARAVDREALVQKFLDAYPSLVVDASNRLGAAFNMRMFPGSMKLPDGSIEVSVSQGQRVMSKAFSMEYSLEVADREAGIRAVEKLNAVSKEFVEREIRKARESASALAQEIRDGLRVAFADLIEKAADMLKPTEGTEKKAFRGSNLEKIQDFLAMFDNKNVTGDGDLAAVVRKARELMSENPPELLKDERPARERLGRALEGIKEQLAPMVANAAKRKIDLDME